MPDTPVKGDDVPHVPDGKDPDRPRDLTTLIYAVFVAGLCSIIYELLIATTVAYFDGDSVRAFSFTIGIYMAALGAGAYLSKYIRGDLVRSLVIAETVLGLLGGFAVPILYLVFAHTDDLFIPAWIFLTATIGVLIGLEVPLLTRLLEQYRSLRVSIAHVLSLDYAGALVATVAFPLLLLPWLGTFRIGLVFGLINMSIGLLLLLQFRHRLDRAFGRLFLILTALIAIAILAGLLLANVALRAWNQTAYDGRIVYTKQSRFQQIVLTRYRGDLRLYLNGNLQFSSVDEYRYHEPLVLIPLAAFRARSDRPVNLLFLGGGDGLAVRQALKDPKVASVTLVDLDKAVTDLGQRNPHLLALNRKALADKRVRVVNADAFKFLKDRRRLYDVIIADLPDPGASALARLYTTGFYKLALNGLAPDGIFATQGTSPYFARKAYWGIHASVKAVFPHAYPFHAQVPSFGHWGFVMASRQPIDTAALARHLPKPTRFLASGTLPALFRFPPDIGPVAVQPSTLDQPKILQYYLQGWKHWGR